jgi:hypothetical protein
MARALTISEYSFKQQTKCSSFRWRMFPSVVYLLEKANSAHHSHTGCANTLRHSIPNQCGEITIFGLPIRAYLPSTYHVGELALPSSVWSDSRCIIFLTGNITPVAQHDCSMLITSFRNYTCLSVPLAAIAT